VFLPIVAFLSAPGQLTLVPLRDVSVVKTLRPPVKQRRRAGVIRTEALHSRHREEGAHLRTLYLLSRQT
jgi:hypothetical protein